MKRALIWLLPVACLAAIVAPLVLAIPTVPQTPTTLLVSFVLRRWSPHGTLVAAVAALVLSVQLWPQTRTVFGRTALLLAFLVTASMPWLAWKNPFEFIFNPQPAASYTQAGKADFVEPGDIVLAVAIAGDAAAYPVRQLAYHHVVNDVVGGVPLVATY